MLKIDKAYKLLFVIYTPIAIVAYLFSFFQVVPITYVSYGVFVGSIIISIVILIRYYFQSKREHSDENEPLLLKRRFLIPFLMFTVLSGLFVCYNLFHEGTVYSSENKHDKRQRIVILLPLDKMKADQPAYQDGKRQAYGYVDLIEKESGILDKYDIVFRNHEMNDTKALEIVRDELKMGTNYFISTMSHISEKLSEEFPKLVETYKMEDKESAKLVVTVASSSKIVVRVNQVYRFYIRSNEESALLAQHYRSLNVNNRLVTIAVDDNYGNRAIEVFNDTYQKPFDIIIRLGKKWNKEEIAAEIQKKISKNNVKNTFFIVHYGNGLDNIISTIDSLGLNGDFLISHPITVSEWYQPVKSILKKYHWSTCYPESANGGIYESDDIIRDFVYFSLHRLVRSIDKSKVSRISFDSSWRNCDEPNRLKYNISSDGDSEIGLKVKSY